MPLLYYVTDRSAFPGDDPSRQKALLANIREAARAGIDFIQLREKDLSGRELELLARAALQAISSAAGSSTKLLINSRTDIALAAAADGVHLPSHDLTPGEVRSIWTHAGRGKPIISIACHTAEEVRNAADASVNYVLFAPVFGKKDAPGVPAAGLEALRDASRANVPVLALGGITSTNARACIDAGATGIAAIRLFQDGDLAETVRQLRESLRTTQEIDHRT